MHQTVRREVLKIEREDRGWETVYDACLRCVMVWKLYMEEDAVARKSRDDSSGGAEIID